ncbi:hypothetical protein ACHAPJ_012194 [Fusarium lateritium]
MATQKKHYFLSPTRSTPEGPIRLGSIISTPALADDPINEEYISLSSVPMDIIEHNEPNYRFEMCTSTSGSVGIWASFLQVLGIGGDVTADWSRENSQAWDCENLKTISFRPKLSYITQCLEDEGVQSYMRVNKPWLGTSKLYMITGIKVAYGASSTIRYARGKGFNLRFGVDLASQGVPLSVGPEYGRNNAISVQQSQDGAEPFVFAFRLRRIKISKKGNLRHESYDKGAMLCINESQASSDPSTELQVIVEGLEDDVDGSEFQLESKNVFDEGSPGDEVCRCSATEDD